MNTMKHSEKKKMATISQLLLPYKASKNNTTLLLAAALEEYQSKIESLQKQLQMAIIENAGLRRDIESLQRIQHGRQEHSISKEIDIDDDSQLKINPSFCSPEYRARNLPLKTKEQDGNIVRVRVSGNTTSMQRQVLSSLLDYLNTADSNDDFDSIRIRAFDALEALRETIPIVNCRMQNDTKTTKEKSKSILGLEKQESDEICQRKGHHTLVSEQFVAKLKDHLGNFLDFDSHTLDQKGSLIFLKSEVLIHALELLMDERDIFIDEITMINNMKINHEQME